MRDHGGTLSFAPRLPARLERLAFGLRFRGRLVRVVVTKDAATYEVQGGDGLELRHHGSALVVRTGEPVTEPIPPSRVRADPDTAGGSRARSAPQPALSQLHGAGRTKGGQ